MEHSNFETEGKESYSKPQLTLYGSVKEITAGGLSGSTDVPLGAS